MPGKSAFPIVTLAAITLTCIYAALLLFSASRESQTFDEAAHIAAGYSYWIKQDYRLNPEHPPFSKLLCTVPLLLLKPKFPADLIAWGESDEFQLGNELLYHSGFDAQRILVACRTVTILFTSCFAICLGWWSSQNLSRRAGALVFLLFILDPNFGAHGRYVTSDVFVSAFFFFACAFWYSWLRTGSKRSLWMTGAAVGLALLSKFSALLLFPILLAMWFLHRRMEQQPAVGRVPVHIAAALVVLPALLIVTCYRGDTRSVAGDPLIHSRLLARARTAAQWEYVPIPAYYWFRGIQLLARHQHAGHPAYLLGTMSTSGFRAYFPIAILVKTATGTLLLTALAFFWTRWPLSSRWHFTLPVAFAVPMVFYLGVAILSHIDIGIRHILVLYPFGYVVLAHMADKLWTRKFVPPLAAAALLINLIEFACIYPNPLALFNTVSGGPVSGPRYLLDSNLDWGQGLIHLREALAERPPSCVAIAYWGQADVQYYLPGAKVAPTTLSQAKSQPCLIAVSVNSLYMDPKRRWSYLLPYNRLRGPVTRSTYMT